MNPWHLPSDGDENSLFDEGDDPFSDIEGPPEQAADASAWTMPIEPSIQGDVRRVRDHSSANGGGESDHGRSSSAEVTIADQSVIGQLISDHETPNLMLQRFRLKPGKHTRAGDYVSISSTNA